MEEWKSIIRFEGLYDVSSEGRVRSLWDGRHKIHRIKVLKPRKNKGGYLHVNLWKDGEMKTFKVHRLVASSFIKNPLNKSDVNHKNEIKTDNRVDNLEWMTRKENIKYGTRTERCSKAQSKPVLQYTKEEVLVKEYPSTIEASRHTGINQGSISSCCIGRIKSAGGSLWKYKK